MNSRHEPRAGHQLVRYSQHAPGARNDEILEGKAHHTQETGNVFYLSNSRTDNTKFMSDPWPGRPVFSLEMCCRRGRLPLRRVRFLMPCSQTPPPPPLSILRRPYRRNNSPLCFSRRNTNMLGFRGSTAMVAAAAATVAPGTLNDGGGVRERAQRSIFVRYAKNEIGFNTHVVRREK